MSETAAPHAEDFPTHQAYSHAWYRWRALCRDAELNRDERAAQFEVIDRLLASLQPVRAPGR